MFGNLITNRQLRALRKDGSIMIEPFDETNLKRTHYTLNPGRILRRSEDGDWDTAFTFSGKRMQCELKANEYSIVEVKQTIKINSDGIVGRFVTASTNIETGLLVMAGQIDSHYGMNGEALRFGLKNLLATPNSLNINSRLAHLEFFDLRGIAPDPVSRSRAEEAAWLSRRRGPDWERDDADGVKYE